MDGKRLIEKIRLRNILSFGDKGEEIELQPLNVIIGQNASGKSNLIDVIKLLRSIPQEKGMANFISRSGGIGEWIWKGNRSIETASITLLISDIKNVEYNIAFKQHLQRLFITSEIIIDLHDDSILKRNGIKEDESILADTLQDIFEEGVFTFRNYIRNRLSIFLFFTNIPANRGSEIRKPQVPDIPNDFLVEDASNLALVLNDLEHQGDTKDKIVENLKKFYPRIKDYSVRILGGTVQLFIREEGLEKPISAMRLSDGTLRYLCLLAILCHPEPPPLICIEEPETGLHPDILPTIAELLKEASEHTQLIVTTHSDILVSALSDVPEAVLVCEKDEDGTHFKRLNKENLKDWLNEYSLGELWLKGEIGGTRW
ncbi:MAG: AAA family ATPase [Pyrinomonadaceae bacterium]|nr:AAA family ATPase [Pyrinomonadaceae bacterium]